MHIPWNSLCVHLGSVTKKPGSDFHGGLSAGGISLQDAVCAQTSADEQTFCVVPLSQHSQEVTKATCKGFRLPTAPLMGLQPPSIRLSSAISSIKNSICFNFVWVDPHLFFWDTPGLLFTLCMIRKPNQACPFRCRSLQIEFSGTAGSH